ncbi:single-stranded DNA-binding protein, partial [Halobium palmae]
RRAEAEGEYLVSLAVPPGDDLEPVRRRIERDHSETDIGEEAVDTRLTDALDRLRRVLGDYETVPENGLVALVGVVDGDDVEYVFDDLPSAVSEPLYEHGNEFAVEPLDTAVGADAAFGLLVVETEEAVLGRYEGGAVETLGTVDGNVPGKARSARGSEDQFDRRRDEEKAEFFDEVAAEAERRFLGDDPVDGVALGGTEVTV